MGMRPELQTPYWQIDGDSEKAPKLLVLAKRMWSAARPVLGILRRATSHWAVAALIAQLVGGGITMATLLLTTQLLQRLLGAAPIAERLHSSGPFLLLLCVAFLMHVACDATSEAAKVHMSPKIRRTAEQDLIDASLGVDLASFDESKFYDQLQRARDRGIQYFDTATTQFVEVLSATFSAGGAAVALFLLQPLLVPILMLAVLPIGWAAVESARVQYAGMSKTITLTRHARIVGELATRRESAVEIRANQTQQYVSSEYSHCAADLEKHMVAQGVIEAKFTTLGTLLSGVGMLVTLVALGAMFYWGWLDLAVAGTAVIAVRSSEAALARLTQAARGLFEAGLYIGDYQEFLEQSSKRKRPAEGTSVACKPGCITLEDVSFCYPHVTREAVSGVSMSIEEGQIVALVGENGSGKSTIAKLIAGLYTPSGGKITWGGVDLRSISPDSLADRIAMVAQEPVRWPRSASDNVRIGRYGRQDPDDRCLYRAAAESGAFDVIDKLPNRWDTVLSRQFRDGHDLSGGEWQRMAIARGIYRDAPLVIWDEPATSLDAKAESLIYESLRKLAKGRTVILITHRLSSISNADRIFFLEKGCLREQGRHAELMCLNGGYAALYKLQSKLSRMEDALAGKQVGCA